MDRSTGVARLVVGILALVLAGCGAIPAAAQGVAQFYKGRTLSLLTFAPGGRYDLTSRLVAKHLGRFIPGQPTIVVQVEPGAGGLVVANRLANTSERDGSVIALIQPGTWQVAIQGDPNARFNPLKMSWLGSLSSFAEDADLLVVSAKHPAQTAEDLKKPGLSTKLGAGTPGSTNLTFAILAKELLGLNLDVVRGYPGAPNIFVGMENGEVDGQLVTLTSLTGTQPEIWRTRQVRPLVQFGRKTRLSTLPDVPTGRELVKDQKALALLEFAELPFFMALPLVAPPDIPPERLQALRAAFTAMTADPSFIADFTTAGFELSLIDAGAIETLLTKAAATPKDIITRYNEIVQ